MGHKGIYGVAIAGLAAAMLTPAPAMAQQDRVSGTEKGSLLMFSKFEVRWESTGELVQDTFIQMSNDHPNDIKVQFYVVNGDDAIAGHPGWNYFDIETTLTGNQPFWWALGREEGPGAFQPVRVLDPGENGEPPHGRPANDGTDDWYLRGFVYGWAVDDVDNLEVKHNHLSGTATLVNYRYKTAWEYNAWAFQRLNEDAGDGVLNLDNAEYAGVYSQLLINFQAAGSDAWGPTSNTDVTLHAASADLRPDAPGVPVTTKAHYDVWNENEVKLSGAYRCLTCWDQTLLSDYGIPNHFTIIHLQTNHGKARIDGLASPLCTGSIDAAILGVVARELRFGPGGDMGGRAMSGTNMIGMGNEAAVVQYAPLAPPPEKPATPFQKVNSLLKGLRSF